MLKLVICALLLSPIVGQNTTPCYCEKADFNFEFGTHTAYEDVHPNDAPAPVSLPNCQPEQFWIICRHGTRNPRAATVSRMQVLKAIRDIIVENHEIQKRGDLCCKDLENLRKWNLDTDRTIPVELAPQGYDDLRNLAKRYKTRFPSLLDQPYSEQKFQFRSTDTQRTMSSGNAFAEGLFGAAKVKFAAHQNPDMLLKAFEDCEAWKENAHKAEQQMIEYDNGTQMTMLRKNVSKRLGFNSTLCVSNIDGMYEACCFEHAWHPSEISPWCAVFDDEELKILEYRTDLKQYHLNGYIYDKNIYLGFPPVKDFIDRFSALEVCERQQPAGVFYFTHSDVLEQMLLSFGVGKDKHHLSHCNYNQMKNRRWRTSKLIPFAANLVAVFFRCDKGEPFLVQFYFNEQPMEVEGCENGLCDWTMVKKMFDAVLQHFTLEFCQKENKK